MTTLPQYRRLVKHNAFQGFRITKFLSNNMLALQHIPCEEHNEIKSSTRVLGQNWKTDSDEFFVDPLQNFPFLADNYTQRKIFSLLSSIFDPLEIIAPVTIRLKALLQQIWRLGLKWDNQIPTDHQHKLQKFLDSFLRMERITVPRILFQIKAINRGVWKYTRLL